MRCGKDVVGRKDAVEGAFLSVVRCMQKRTSHFAHVCVAAACLVLAAI